MTRLNKYIAASGVTSRRQADRLILQGKVSVNGCVVTELGVQVDPTCDRVTVEGRAIREEPSFEYLLLHKPPGYLTTVHDPFGRPTVMDLLPQSNFRVYPVGRLDNDTSGLLLFTNDGQLTLALTHPRHLVEKVYLAQVKGIPSKEELARLASGILLEDGWTAPAKIEIIATQNGHATIRLKIREGRKRQVRRMLQAIGYPVCKLQRIAMGPLQLGTLEVGRWRRLSRAELEKLLEVKQVFLKERGACR